MPQTPVVGRVVRGPSYTALLQSSLLIGLKRRKKIAFTLKDRAGNIHHFFGYAYGYDFLAKGIVNIRGWVHNGNPQNLTRVQVRGYNTYKRRGGEMTELVVTPEETVLCASCCSGIPPTR